MRGAARGAAGRPAGARGRRRRPGDDQRRVPRGPLDQGRRRRVRAGRARAPSPTAFETALDGVRSGSVAADEDTIKLFFRCGRHARRPRPRRARRGGRWTPGTIAGRPRRRWPSSPGRREDDGRRRLDFQPMAWRSTSTTSATSALRCRRRDGTSASRRAPSSSRRGNEPLFLMRALARPGRADGPADLSRVPALDGPRPCGGLSGLDDASRHRRAGKRRSARSSTSSRTSATSTSSRRPARRDAERSRPRTSPCEPRSRSTGAEGTRASPRDRATADAGPRRRSAARSASTPVQPRSGRWRRRKATMRVDLDRVDRLIEPRRRARHQPGDAVAARRRGRRRATNSPVTTGLDDPSNSRARSRTA